MPTTETPVMRLDRQCVAAAVLFAIASLRKFNEADQPGLRHSPEAACLRRKAQLYSDLGADMTQLAQHFATPLRTEGMR